MNAKQQWVEAQKRAALARQQRMRTAGDCNEPQNCNIVPFAERAVNPNHVRYLSPRQWYVVSSLNPDGTARAATVFGIPSGLTGVGIPAFPQGFEFDVAAGFCLWSLGVDYPTVDGMVQIGLNNPPIPVRAGVLFNLDTTKFPCELCGPLHVRIQGGVVAGDPPVDVPVNFYAIVAEVGDDV